MMAFRVFAVATLVAGALLTQGRAFAQDNSGDAVPKATSVDAPAPAVPIELKAGSIHATLTATPTSGRYSAGTSAFAQIRVSSEAATKRGLAAELVLEAGHGEIVGVTGAKADTDKAGGVQKVGLSGIRPGHDRSLLVEVRLRAAEGNPPNTLKLTLRTSAAGRRDKEGDDAEPSSSHEDTTLLTWPVTDCAGGYMAALRQIGAEKGNRLRDIWRAASRPDKSMSRAWLFRPAIPKRAARRHNASPDVTASIAARDAREIFVEAGRLLHAGYDPDLGRYSETLDKTANDLRKYLSQDANPAICTGAVAFTNYYEGKLSPLRKRGEKLKALSASARQLARERADAIFEAARDLPLGHPGLGGATLATLRPIEGRSNDPKAMVADLAEIAGLPDAFIADLRAADGPYAALRAVEDHGFDDTELPKETRADLRQALSSIEAAVLLDSFVARYDGFWDGFYGSLQAIRDAHGKNCVCDG